MGSQRRRFATVTAIVLVGIAAASSAVFTVVYSLFFLAIVLSLVVVKPTGFSPQNRHLR